MTRACLTCHTGAAKEIHKTQHWKWEYVNPTTGQVLGKRHVVNNFCTSAASNLGGCATCHVGYGLKDEGFDFTSEQNVDCLVCHDTTGKYKKQAGLAGNVFSKDIELPPGSGNIIKGSDLKAVAQHVGKTSRMTCGTCHFNGGGGDGVKHGDLDGSLEVPEKALDVHMDADGNNFTCATCHKTESHQVPGSRYAPTAQDKGPAHLRGKADTSNPGTCQACHGQTPHKAKREAERPHGQGGMPDLPHSDVRTRRHTDQDVLGLVHRRKTRPRRQAAGCQERRRPRRLQRHQGRFRDGREGGSGVHLVQRNGEVHAARGQDRGQRQARTA